jgi:hypothetical protein
VTLTHDEVIIHTTNPQVATTALPGIMEANGLHCWRCDKLLAEQISAPYTITCSRCHAKNKRAVDALK